MEEFHIQYIVHCSDYTRGLVMESKFAVIIFSPDIIGVLSNKVQAQQEGSGAYILKQDYFKSMY